MPNVFVRSEPGGHLTNEDAFEVQPHPTDPGYWLCTLADGQGGRAGGARAAQLACRTAMGIAAGYPPARLTDATAWLTILRSADEAVSADAEAGFTTLVGFCLAGESLAGASSGDSAVLLVLAGGRSEELTSKQLKNPPVGSRGALFVPFRTRLSDAWTVLAMSDGVWKYVGWERTKETALRTRGQQLVDGLQQRARLPGSGQLQDDFTLVVFQEGDREADTL